MMLEARAFADLLRTFIPEGAVALATFDHEHIQLFALDARDEKAQFAGPEFIYPDNLDEILELFGKLAELLPFFENQEQKDLLNRGNPPHGLRQKYGVELGPCGGLTVYAHTRGLVEI